MRYLKELFVITIVSIFIMGCEDKKEKTPSLADFSQLQKIKVNETKLLNIPTYDGSGEVVHPDIMIKDREFKMAITPYASSNLDLENPSYYISGNGIDFHPPKGLENPLVGKPKSGYNDDPDIIYNDKTKEYYIYYNETPFDEKSRTWDRQYLNLLTSKNSVDWKNQKLITFDFKRGDPFIVSPSIVVKDSIYHMFFIHIDNVNDHYCNAQDPHKHQIEEMISKDGLHWDKSKINNVDISLPKDFNPWHMNIIEDSGRYYMLVNGYEHSFCNNHSLYLAYSDNLKDWNFVEKPLIKPSESLYNSRNIYRSAAVIDGDDLYIYFSFYRFDKTWGVAIKRVSIEDTI